VLLVDNSATVVYDPDKISEADIIQHIEDVGYDAKAVSRTSTPAIQPQIVSKDVSSGQPDATRQIRLYKVNLSIGGMTCASCVNTITHMLKNLKGVKESNVDLMNNSGYAIVEDKDLASTIENEIEDLGYEAKIMDVEPVTVQSSSQSDEEERQPRVTHVKIEGFFCEHCPAKANQVLEDLSKRFQITFTPSTLNNPVSTLTYIPSPPDFTLRTIRRAITELGFTISVVKPETLQDRAKLAQARERKRILLRSFAHHSRPFRPCHSHTIRHWSVLLRKGIQKLARCVEEAQRKGRYEESLD
jgi:Cu+-exporting ATPase